MKGLYHYFIKPLSVDCQAFDLNFIVDVDISKIQTLGGIANINTKVLLCYQLVYAESSSSISVITTFAN